jgi:DNA-binding response OmpR family regulator
MTNHVIEILLVEDNRADVTLVEEALRMHDLSVKLFVMDDGEKAIHFIDQIDRDPGAQCPQLFLLDLNLPRRSGEEILARKLESEKCRKIPVIILTSSDSPRDRANTTRLGADRYFRKPPSFDGFMEIGAVVRDVLAKAKAQANGY